MQRMEYEQILNIQLLSSPLPPYARQDTVSTTQILPTLIADYRPNERTGLKLRLRKLMGTIDDFELLSPRDQFLFSLNDLPQAAVYGLWFGMGKSFEFEINHTLHNGGLLRLGLFQQNLDEAQQLAVATQASQPASDARIRGIRLGAEGAFNRETTYFVNLGLNDARGYIDTGAGAVEQKYANVPDFIASAGLQYLNDHGYFVQPTYFYLDKRFRRNGTTASGAYILNLRIGKRFGVRSMLFVEVANILNENYEVFEEIQPGRQLHIGGQLRF